MPTVASAPAAGIQRSPKEQVAALASFVQAKFPRFPAEAATDILSEVSPVAGELKPLARRLQQALAARGISIKYDSALSAAARVQGYASWHEARSHSAQQGLVVTWWQREAKPRQVFRDWAQVGTAMANFCDEWLATHGGRAFQVHVAPDRISLTIPTQEVAQDEFGRHPLAGVRSQGWSGDWLAGATGALEHLRRRLEETGKAVLDGFAVAQLCQANGPQNFPGGTAANAANSELVLRLASPDGGLLEIARGDEMACWSELDFITQTQDDAICDEDGAWLLDAKRFAWYLQTTNSLQSSFVLATVPLKPEQSRRLLRRYLNARRLFRGDLLAYEPVKQLAYLADVPATIGVNLPELLARMQAQGLSWVGYGEECGQVVEMISALPMEFLFGLFKRLGIRDASRLMLEPDRGNLTFVENDEMLAHLMPRIDCVRHRISARVSPTQAAQLKALVDAFETASHDMQVSAEEAMFAKTKRAPYASFSARTSRLRAGITAMGLALYAGVMWNLEPNDSTSETLGLPGATIWPYGVSLALFLDIDYAEVRNETH